MPSTLPPRPPAGRNHPPTQVRAVERRVVNPWTWQDALGYAQAVEVVAGQRVLHCAGQAAMGADGRPQHPARMGTQVALAMDNLESVLARGGYGLGDVVRLTYHTTDVDDFFAHYGLVVARLAAAGCRPASTLLGVTRLAFPGLMVGIEATAAR